MKKGEAYAFSELIASGGVNMSTLSEDERNQETWDSFINGKRSLESMLSVFYITHCAITERKKNPDFITQSLGLSFLIALHGNKEEREVKDGLPLEKKEKKTEIISILNSQLFSGEVGMTTFAYKAWNSNQGMLLNLRDRHRIGTTNQVINGVLSKTKRVFPNQLTIQKDLSSYTVSTLNWFSHDEGISMMEKAQKSGKYTLIRPYHTAQRDSMLLNLVGEIPFIPSSGPLLILEHDAIIESTLTKVTNNLINMV